MKEILKDLGSHIRSLGFKGSGQNFRKLEEDFVFVINIQGSSSGKDFYVNLGAQPTFIPTKCDRPLATLKEYQCVLRTRVGVRWEWSLDEQALDALKREIELTQREFFVLARTMRASIAQDSVDQLLDKFKMGNAALHLARATAALGHPDKAEALVERGLSTAGERAPGLIHDLQAVRKAFTSQPGAFP